MGHVLDKPLGHVRIVRQGSEYTYVKRLLKAREMEDVTFSSHNVNGSLLV